MMIMPMIIVVRERCSALPHPKGRAGTKFTRFAS
ncbi:hypothetical protein ABIB82_006099 [Bradyrhizobium sp. i1.8.4]